MQTGTIARIRLPLLAALWGITLWLISSGAASNDLRALWLAAGALLQGDTDAVYAGSAGLFTMTPPQAWADAAMTEGAEGPLYPFIYPPLWAWVMSHAAAVADFASVAAIALPVNVLLILLTVYLAARIIRPSIDATHYLLIAAFALTGSMAVLLPLWEGQPQILVTFLTILAIERTRHAAPITGGAALALAASIKLYPVLFALIWLAEGQRRAVAATALAGLALGIASILATGWALHVQFLREIAAISATALVSYSTYCFDSMAAFLFRADHLMLFDTRAMGGQTQWFVTPKSPVWQLLDKLVILSALSLLWILARRGASRDPLFWPGALVLISLVSPLSWIYHYLSALVFLPALVDRLGQRRGLALIALLILPSTSLCFSLKGRFDAFEPFVIPLNFAALCGMAGLFLGLSILSRRTPSPCVPAALPYKAGRFAKPGVGPCRKEPISSPS